MRLKAVCVKIILVLSAVVVVFGLAEISLRLVTRYYFADRYKASYKPGNQTDIVCLGNSYTAGVGAPSGQSYCHQLQKLALEKGYSFVVQNWAQPMHNTHDILGLLRSRLRDTRPKLALIMAGEPNFVNYKGIGEYTLNRDIWFGLKYQLADWLHRYSSVFRLYVLLENNKAEKPNNWPFQVKDESDDVEIAYKWLSWGRTQVPSLQMTPEHARSALLATEKIKKWDSNNLAAPLLKADLLAYEFAQPEAAVNELRSLPESAAPCLAVLEYQKKFRQNKIEFSVGRKFLKEVRTHWSKTLAQDELVTLDNIVSPRSEKYASEKIKTKLFQRVLPHLMTIDRCGTPGDSLTHFLISRLRHEKDFSTEAQVMENHLAAFPFSEYVDIFSLMNAFYLGKKSARNIVNLEEAAMPAGLPPISVLDRYQEIREKHRQTFGGRLESSAPVRGSVIGKWIEYDLGQMVQLLKSQEVEVVFMTYPPVRGLISPQGDPLPAQKVDLHIRNVASAYGIPVFDTYTLLHNDFTAQKDIFAFYSDQYGPHDSHLNARGYGIIAQKLLDFFEKQEMIRRVLN